MSEFARFPSTPYLVAPSGVGVRSDKVLDVAERSRFLKGALRVEEKIDGQNLGISGDGGRLRYQSRGSYVELGGRHFQGLEAWIRPRDKRLREALGDELVLFGEWVAVAHSVQYECLPDWFLLFDVFDRGQRAFLSADVRRDIAVELSLATVPVLDEGVFELDALEALVEEPSRFGANQMEGVVLRALDPGAPTPRAKLVRGGFVQQIGEHWTKGRLVRNRLA